MIDLRSDTVTRPTQAMRDAMYVAEVGDDVYGEDPTVARLEQTAAEMLDKEAAVFVASGTQSNLIGLLTHCGRGDEYIAGQTAHTYRFEGGGAAALGGIQPQPIDFEPDGSLDLERVSQCIKPRDPHFARTRLLCLENTQAGKPLAPEYVAAAQRLCREHGLSLHMDGARLFNACVAMQCDPPAYARHCDSISICLSKGLGAPVGSVLVGDLAFISEARRWRKMVGGGMRQAGVVAAAGVHALTQHVQRLAEDHERANAVAAAVNRRRPQAATAQTNMVLVDFSTAELASITAHFAAAGIVIRNNRWVLHLDIGSAELDRIVTAIDSWTGATA